MPPASPLPKGVDLRPSGMFRARLTYKGRKYTAEWETPHMAEMWILRTRRELMLGTYIDPATTVAQVAEAEAAMPTVGTYARQWVDGRNLKPRTRSDYLKMLPAFDPIAGMPLDQVTRADIKVWHAGLRMGSTAKRHRYELLRAVFNTAVDDELVDVSPVRIRGAASTPRKPMPDLPTAAQVHQLAQAMPSDKFRVLTLVSAWCGLRYGEATELRRKDLILSDDGTTPLAIRVRRGVTRVDGVFIVGTPKTRAGIRDVVIPPHIRGDLQDYLHTLPAKPDRLLFPSTRPTVHLAPSSLYKPFYRARAAVGLPGLNWHGLRHFSATAAAQSGATLAELQARLGHSSVAASMRYQHAAAGRDAVIAEAMSNVVELKPRTA